MRLPKSVRFADDAREVSVRREGRKVILEPLDERPREFVACLGAWSETIERPLQRSIPDVRHPFERPRESSAKPTR